MHLHLQNPYPLLAALLPLTLLILHPKKFLLPTISAILILLALATPTLTWSTTPDRIILLLDLSASTRNSPLRNPQWLRTLAQRTLPPNTHLTILAFAQSQKILIDDISPSDPDHWPSTWEPFPPETDKPTDISAALNWRYPSETNAALAPRWLLTDGLTPPLQTPPHMQLAITFIPPEPDLAITDLLHTTNGNLLAHLRSTTFHNSEFIIHNSSTLTLTRNNKIISTQNLTLTPNQDRWITLHDPTPTTSPTLYQLTAHLNPPDLFPENDTASLLYTPPGPPNILEIKNPSDLPINISTLLQSNTQAILLPDTLPLTPQNTQILEQFVKDIGGGLLLLGKNFPPQIQSLSPLTPDNPNRPPLHLIFLLDASGSMNEPINSESKIHFATQAIAQAGALLHPADHLTLITFSNTAQLQLDTAAKNFPQLLSQKNLSATGPTIPDAALPLLQQQLANPNEKQILLLLTDGQIPSLNLPQWNSLLTHTTLLLIAPQPETGPLKNLLINPNAKLFPTTDPAQWQLLLQQSLTTELRAPPRHDPLHWQTLASPSITGTTNTWTQLYLSTNSEPLALGIDNTKTQWPLAALAHRGLGHVAALSTDNPPATLTNYLLAQIAAPDTDLRFTITTTRTSGGYHLTIDALENQQFLSNESLKLRILSEPSENQIPIPLTAPGKYELDLRTNSALSAILFRTDKEQADHLIAHVQPALVETSEWPATVERHTEIPSGALNLDGYEKGEKRYFMGENREDLGGFCWCLGAIFILGALAFRRR